MASVATALLLLENVAERFAAPGATPGEDFREQREFVSSRLTAMKDGNLLRTAPGIPLLDEMSRRAQERLITNQVVLQRIGGVVTIIMGLVFIGFIPALQRQVRFTPRRLAGLAGAPLLGAVFALGWTPCLGPTLTGVIAVASATDGASVARGVALVIAYCMGLGIPFLALAVGSGWAVGAFDWLRRNTRAIQVLGGVLLIVVGLALVTGAWNEFISWIRAGFVSDVRLPI